jgi:hypothetical protein
LAACSSAATTPSSAPTSSPPATSIPATSATVPAASAAVSAGSAVIGDVSTEKTALRCRITSHPIWLPNPSTAPTTRASRWPGTSIPGTRPHRGTARLRASVAGSTRSPSTITLRPPRTTAKIQVVRVVRVKRAMTESSQRWALVIAGFRARIGGDLHLHDASHAQQRHRNRPARDAHDHLLRVGVHAGGQAWLLEGDGLCCGELGCARASGAGCSGLALAAAESSSAAPAWAALEARPCT